MILNKIFSFVIYLLTTLCFVGVVKAQEIDEEIDINNLYQTWHLNGTGLFDEVPELDKQTWIFTKDNSLTVIDIFDNWLINGEPFEIEQDGELYILVASNGELLVEYLSPTSLMLSSSDGSVLRFSIEPN